MPLRGSSRRRKLPLTTCRLSLKCCDRSSYTTMNHPAPMADPPREEPTGTGAMLEASRREKLKTIQALGFDPWGTASTATSPSPPSAPARTKSSSSRPATAKSGKPPEQHGPTGPRRRPDRAPAQGRQAGLPRQSRTGPAGSRCSIGKKQVGETELGPGRVLRPGRHRRRRRRAEAHEDRRADDLRRAAPLPVASRSKRRRPSTRA